MTGELAILNCTDGDTRISFNSNNPDEVERAKAVVEDMLKRGYCIAVTVGDRMERVVGFDPKACEYVVTNNAPAGPPPETPHPKQAPTGRGRRQRVPAKTARAVAVGPTAGGGLGCRHFPIRRSNLQ